MKINSILKSVLVVFAFVLVSATVMVSCKGKEAEATTEEATEVVDTTAAPVVDTTATAVDTTTAPAE
ncbi:MAG: hypothetical protein ACM3PT_02540 [Deltaproteobacteria bacterium]